MAHYSEAKGSGHRGRKISHLEVSGHKSRGYSVKAHYEQDGGGYKSPSEMNFGKDEGKAMLAHVAEHMGVDAESPAEDAGEPGEE